MARLDASPRSVFRRTDVMTNASPWLTPKRSRAMPDSSRPVVFAGVGGSALVERCKGRASFSAEPLKPDFTRLNSGQRSEADLLDQDTA